MTHQESAKLAEPLNRSLHQYTLIREGCAGMRLSFSCSATLVGKSIIVLGGTGTRAWSLKEVRLTSCYESNIC